jgi:hypothetical protein
MRDVVVVVALARGENECPDITESVTVLSHRTRFVECQFKSERKENKNITTRLYYYFQKIISIYSY